MLTEKEMDDLAEQLVAEWAAKSNLEMIVSSELTIKKPYGNIYHYNSPKFITAEDYQYALIGNAFGTYAETAYFIREYEAGRRPNNVVVNVTFPEK